MNTAHLTGVERTCVHCGVHFQGHPATLYCSERCRVKARRLRQAARLLAPAQQQPTPPAGPIEAREWNGTAIQRRNADGFVNATAMCQANGKRWTLYQANERTQAYIAALAAEVGIPTSDLTDVNKGGRPDQQGTWIHPRLAVDLARWISPEFAVWMDGWFLETIAGHRQAPQQPFAQPQPQPQLPAAPLDVPHSAPDASRQVPTIADYLRLLAVKQSRQFCPERQVLIADACITLLFNIYRPRPYKEQVERMLADLRA